MQAFLYRWDLVKGREDAFVAAWSANTIVLKSLGGLGSRLHRGNDGWWYACAQWSDSAARERAFTAALAIDDDADRSAVMRSLIAASLPEIALDLRADLLDPLP